jgi:hypothetical protein
MLPITRRQILQGTAAVAAARLLSGCGSSAAAGGTAQPVLTNPQPVPSGPLTQASMSVTATSAGSIGPAFVGLSYEKSSLTEPLFTGANSNLIGMFQRLGTSVLRIGGNSVDENVWKPNGAGQTSGQIAPSDVTALAAFVKATGWQCLYGINLGGSATGAQTPALAAAEVAYAVQAFGSSLLGIEIGNECDLYGDTGSYYAGNWTLAKFEALWAQYRAAILATTPGVVLTGPASAGNESSWTVPFGQSVTKSEITLLTQHYYRANGQLATSTAAYLITPDSTLVNNLSVLAAGAKGIGVPYRMSEGHSYYNGGASGGSFHGGGNSAGYTPIANSSGTVVGARPEFYGILLFALAGQGALYTTAVSAASLNVTGYAVKTASGLSLVVVNKDATQNLQLSVALPQSVSTATLLEMTQLSSGATAPNLSATDSVTIQGASVGVNGSFAAGAAYTLSASGTQISCYVPALSAVLIQLS